MFDSSNRFCSPRAKKLRRFEGNKVAFDFLSNNLKDGISISESVYRILNNVHSYPKCESCDNVVGYCSFTKGFYKTCQNSKCLRIGYGKNPHIPTQEEREAASLRMKVRNPMFNKDCRLRMTQTQIEKYGTLGLHLEESKRKALENRYDRHNTFSPNNKFYKPKRYTTPSGKLEWIQGYENKALDILFSLNKEEDVVICGRKHKYKYTYEGKQKTYYPDIFIPSRNCYIEVKSDYTYNCSLNKNLLKKASVENAGFRFEFWILDKDCNLNIL